MKSLEIVNKAQEELEIIIDLINKSIDSDYIFKNKMLAQRLLTICELLYRYLDDYIKQDLEVLEILKKLFEDMEIDIWKSKLYNKEIGGIKYSGTDFELDVEDKEVTIEELKKLKQWLEENEE